MHELVDLTELDPGISDELGQPGERALRGIVWRRQAFVELHRTGDAVNQDKIGESSADIEADPIARRARSGRRNGGACNLGHGASKPTAYRAIVAWRRRGVISQRPNCAPAAFGYHGAVSSANPETSVMSTIDVNRVILTGENSVIRLSSIDSDSFTTNATFWRMLSSPGGPGHVLYLKSELTEARWRIYSDNIAMARWLQSTVLGAINAELLDPTIAVTDAQFSKSGDPRDFWTERLDSRDEQIVLTWYQMGEPFLVHTQPNTVPGRPYGMCTVIVPALGARLTRNGIEAKGRPWPRDREGYPTSTCVLGLCESWTQPR